ncbi:MAG: hypothetical protein ACOVP7_12245 [Lacibacter sp.]
MKKLCVLIVWLLCTTLFAQSQVNPSTSKIINSNSPALLTAKEYTLYKLRTELFIPAFKSGGDKDFGGNGPQMKITCQLMISSDRKQILAVLYMSAKETKDNWTLAEGSKTISLFRCNPNQTIESLGETSGYSKMEINVTDNNGHDDQFFLADGQPAVTRAQNSFWYLANAINHTSAVELVRVVGDVNGEDAGVRAGVELFFAPLKVKIKGQKISEIQLNTAVLNKTCGANTCGSSASSTFITFHGFNRSCEQMKAKLDGSPNLINFIRQVSGHNIGIDPNSMRDRLNEISNRFVLVEDARAANIFTHIVQALSNRKPVIVLTGWGSKTIRDIYANSNDPVSLNPNSVLHYLVIDGINQHTRVFSVIDNGERTYLHWDYLKQIIYWRPENAIIEGSLYSNQVKPGKIIY